MEEMEDDLLVRGAKEDQLPLPPILARVGGGAVVVVVILLAPFMVLLVPLSLLLLLQLLLLPPPLFESERMKKPSPTGLN